MPLVLKRPGPLVYPSTLEYFRSNIALDTSTPKSVVADFRDGYSETPAIYGLMTQNILKPPTSMPYPDFQI